MLTGKTDKIKINHLVLGSSFKKVFFMLKAFVGCLPRRSVLVSTIGVFLFFNLLALPKPAFAADDNANQVVCRYDLEDCDGTNGACTNYGYNWTSSGYPGGAGNPSCCGDDSSESYGTHLYAGWSACCGSSSDTPAKCVVGSSGFGSCPANTFCIPSYNWGDCVNKNGSRIAGDSYYNVDSSGDEEYCVQYLSNNTNYGAWHDQDNAGCKYTWFSSSSSCGGAGPGGVCDDADGGAFCCGDDSGENYVNTFCPGASGSARCCNSSSDRIDASGNCVATCPDTTAPSVSVNGAPSGWQNWDASASVGCSDSGSGCNSSTYRLLTTDGSQSCSTGYSNYDLTSPQTVSSETWYCAAAKDNAGNAGFTSSSVQFKVDKTEPTITIGGAPSSWSNSNATMTVSCSDTGGSGCNSSVDSYRLYSSDPFVCPLPRTDTFVGGVTVTGYSEYTGGVTISSYTWVCAGVEDNAGTGAIAKKEFQVDKTTPTASFSGNGSTCEQITWTIASASDSGGSGLNSSPYSFDNGSNWQSSNTLTDTVTGGGSRARIARVRDNAGNEWASSDTMVSTSSCYTYSWYTGSWSSCSGFSDTCDESGTQTRTVYCRRNDGQQVADSYCSGSKPASSQSCSRVTDGTSCSSPILYCSDTSSCDTRQHERQCVSGSCSASSFTNDASASGASCSGQSCGSYANYCLANPGKLRDYSSSSGTCSSSGETCNQPSSSDYCQAGTCSAECSDGNTCSSSQCTGANSAFYQTRTSTSCQSWDCQCPSWGSYGSCQDSWNECSQRVECYQGTGCDTQNGTCACESGYHPNGSGGCDPDATYNWDIGTYSSCSVSCGTGTQTRSVVCRDNNGNQVADSNCPSPKPDTSQSCDAGSCAATTCSPDGCYGTLQWRDYPPAVSNACVSGTCENNTCTYTEACSIASCGAECQTNNCSTSQCDNNGNGFRYQQTRSSTCQGDCLCPVWSVYQSCQDSWNNCPTSGSYSRVECYQGTGCNTATNACTCESGYHANGSGGCDPDTVPDTLAPTIFSPQARPDSYTDTGEWDNDTTIFFTFTATDNVGVTSCNASIGDTTPDEPVADLVNRQDTDTGVEGLNTYYVQCADAAGNNSTPVQSGTISIDATAPSLSSPAYLTVEGTTCSGASCPATAPTITTGDPDISWNTSDTGSGLKQVEVWRGTGACSSTAWEPTAAYTTTVDLSTGSWTDTSRGNDTYCYGLHVIDNAENCRNEDGTLCSATGGANQTARGPITVTINRTSPDFTINLTPPSSLVIQGNSTTYTVAITPSGGFSSTVSTWSVVACPASATCTLSFSTCASASYGNCGTLTVGTTGVTPGSYTTLHVRAASPSTKDSNNVTLTVTTGANQPPVADFQSCKVSGNTIQFISKSFDPDGSISHAWNFGDGSANSALQHPRHNYSTDQTTYLEQMRYVASSWMDGLKATYRSLERTISNWFVDLLGSRTSYAQASWWNTSWTRRRQITMNNTSGSSHTNFPMLVKLNMPNPTNPLDPQNRIDYGQTNNSGADAGYDIRFVDSDTSGCPAAQMVNGKCVLNYEIEKWDGAANGTSYVWVKIPAFNAGSDSVWMYYGNPAASGPWVSAGTTKTAWTQGVWDSNFKLVQHLKEPSGPHNDSTSNGNNSTAVTVTTQGSATGKINGTDDFDGVDDRVTIADSASFDIGTGNATWEAWVALDDNAFKFNGIMSHTNGTTATDGWWITAFPETPTYCPGGSGCITISMNDTDYNSNPLTWTSGTLYYVTVVKSGTTISFYRNGVFLNFVNNGQNINNSAGTFRIGMEGSSYGTGYLDGRIDEVRMSNTNRSANWIDMTYDQAQDTVNTYGAEESSSTSFNVILTVTDNLGATASKSDTVDLLNAPSCDFLLTSVSALACNSVTSSWDLSLAGDQYEVYRRVGAGSWSVLTTLNAADPNCGQFGCSYTDLTTQGNTSYSYYIKAKAGTNTYNNSTSNPSCSGASSICPLSVTTPSCGGTGLTAASNTCGVINVSWDSVQNAVTYNLYISPGSDDPVNVAALSYVDKNIIPGETYYYYVKPKFADNSEGGESQTKSAKSYCYRGPVWEER